MPYNSFAVLQSYRKELTWRYRDPSSDKRSMYGDFPSEDDRRNLPNWAETSGPPEPPGTHFLNATPDNYALLYASGDGSAPMSAIGSAKTTPTGSIKLERFEDYGILSSNASRRTSVAKIEPTITTRSVASFSTDASLVRRMDFTLNGAVMGPARAPATMFDVAFVHSRDLQYYNHYRAVFVYNIQVHSRFPSEVRPHCHAVYETQDPFERAAATFEPLYNAMLAVSALSMAHRERLDRIDALQNYQLAIEGLRQQTVLDSMNMLYTHYFLLLYEVAACENRASLELGHMEQLARLMHWYFTTSVTDPSKVFGDQACPECTKITMTCIPAIMLYCDMHNLYMRRHEFTIIPDVMVTGFFEGVKADSGYPNIEARFSDAELSRKVIELNVLGGWATRVVRQTIEDFNRNDLTQLSELEPRFLELTARIKVSNDWCARHAPQIPGDIYDPAYTSLPIYCQTTYDSSQYTIRQLQLYMHTSIFPKQRKQLTTRREEYIQFLAREILHLTRPRWGTVRPIAASNLVALFICGTVVTSPGEKEEIIRVIETMGAEASGRNFMRAVDALRALYMEQERVKMDNGDERDIDWFVFLREKGLLDFSLFGI
ncbi:uncharacterized protein RSE6_12999 [Rhynchosporium secalis]|uniref:Uncharacterized protein n=1 Tax=Rhynchosporium secalis TaxID=38038 RepID=A0A1E1MRX6_RHYSE|nr:uncharacterized protein RSE6_12999 [Rhynchosporium secalis]